MNKKEIKVLLICGGSSPEREVSKNSSRAIYNALLTLGYSVKLFDPAYGINQPKEAKQFFAKEEYAEVSTKNYLAAFNLDIFSDVDVAFLGLHGRWGEDGTVQALLEMHEIPYTGSDIATCALAMDKFHTKIIFDDFDIPVPAGFLVRIGYKDTTEIYAKAEQLKYPTIVKPNDQGSTVGLTVCETKEELIPAIDLALQFSSGALVEEFIPGRELTVGVIENLALPPLEIRPKKGLYDYESKYTTGMTEYIVPAEIPSEIAEVLKADSLKAFNSLNCKGYSRVDFRLTPEGKHYCLEINTLPGMTATSLMPKMAKAVGITFEELIDKIVNFAL